jgi:membrane fusion protein, multidrug efflux system
VRAHRISPALATLNDRGEVGVFVVGEDDVVAFHPIALVRSESDGVWVTGPPDRARLIIARPGFVQPGQRVIARDADERGVAMDASQ